ncbi:MAG: glyoxalase [Pyrinomonadaceae bacterium]
MGPTITESLVYTPALDFEASKGFYADLGFEMTKGFGDTMDCRLGGAAFRLQNYYVKDWADNFMMKFDVDDVSGWFEHAKTVVESGKYANVRISEIEMVGGSEIFHVWDPSGVLLVFVG